MKFVFWALLLIFLSVGAMETRAIETGTPENPQDPHLQAGDYVWQPQTSPTGPVVIVVDLSKQLLQVYRNGVAIGRTTVSSGKEDHPTPPGIFTILQKRVSHHSNIYHEASMPYMERLTWGGLSIHAGNNPGHPESHGCVHVPMAFAKKLYEITAPGTTVLITDGAAAASAPPAKPSLDFTNSAKGYSHVSAPSSGAPFSWKPGSASTGPVSVVYSSADQRIYIYRNGVEIGWANTGNGGAGQSVGDRVYAALPQTDPDGFHQWQLLGSLDASSAPNAADLLRQLMIPPAFIADMHQTVTPGTTLVITDEPVGHRATPSPNSDILDTASR